MKGFYCLCEIGIRPLSEKKKNPSWNSCSSPTVKANMQMERCLLVLGFPQLGVAVSSSKWSDSVKIGLGKKNVLKCGEGTFGSFIFSFLVYAFEKKI